MHAKVLEHLDKLRLIEPQTSQSREVNCDYLKLLYLIQMGTDVQQEGDQTSTQETIARQLYESDETKICSFEDYLINLKAKPLFVDILD